MPLGQLVRACGEAVLAVLCSGSASQTLGKEDTGCAPGCAWRWLCSRQTTWLARVWGQLLQYRPGAREVPPSCFLHGCHTVASQMWSKFRNSQLQKSHLGTDTHEAFCERHRYPSCLMPFSFYNFRNKIIKAAFKWKYGMEIWKPCICVEFFVHLEEVASLNEERNTQFERAHGQVLKYRGKNTTAFATLPISSYKLFMYFLYFTWAMEARGIFAVSGHSKVHSIQRIGLENTVICNIIH